MTNVLIWFELNGLKYFTLEKFSGMEWQREMQSVHI